MLLVLALLAMLLVLALLAMLLVLALLLPLLASTAFKTKGKFDVQCIAGAAGAAGRGAGAHH